MLILLCGQPAVIGLATSPYEQTNITDSYLLILLCGQPAVIGLATSVDPALWTASSDPLTLISFITLRILKKSLTKRWCEYLSVDPALRTASSDRSSYSADSQ